MDALLLNGGAAAQAQRESTADESYDSSRHESGPSLYEQQLHWEAGDQERRHEKWLRTRHALLCFPFPVLVTIVFLAIGFTLGWWHPAWMLYLTVPIYYCVLGAMK